MKRSSIVVGVVGLVLAAALSFTACRGSDGTPATPTAPTFAEQATTTEPSLSSPPSTEPATNSDGRRVTFATQDDVTLEGVTFGDGPDWVVLAHMRPATMDSWFAFGETLAAEGYTALAFNFRGYGASGGSGFAVDVDTVAAVDLAFASGAETVSVIGASMGGTGAIVAAAQRDLAGVIAISAPAVFSGVDGTAAIASVRTPTLLVAGADDQPYASDVGLLAAGAPSAVNTLFLTGTAHGTDLFADHEAELRDQILAHLRSSLE